MSNFKVGDKVLCVKTNVSNSGVGVVSGNEYIIYDILVCSCGHTMFNVGITNPLNYCTGCRCGILLKPFNIWWHASERFVKADEQDNFASEVLEEIAEKIEVEFIELHNK